MLLRSLDALIEGTTPAIGERWLQKIHAVLAGGVIGLLVRGARDVGDSVPLGGDDLAALYGDDDLFLPTARAEGLVLGEIDAVLGLDLAEGEARDREA